MVSGSRPAPVPPPRPPFLEGWPPHPELDTLVAAFLAGNYRFVRAHARELSERADAPPAVRRAAGELCARLRPDPMVLVLLACCFALLVVVFVWTYAGPGSAQRRIDQDSPLQTRDSRQAPLP